MIPEEVAVLIANIEVLISWAACGAFLGFYFFKSPWNLTTVGRTLFYAQLAMFILLTLALTGRWIEPAQDLYLLLALASYTFITVMQIALFQMLRLVQTGRVTMDNPDYAPIRDWLRKQARKLNPKKEKQP